jgi:rSAM/selenodomain-associated transferase 2
MLPISVVIPTWNEAQTIGAAVRRAWDLSPREVLVADGGSSDATRELAASAGATVLLSAPGRGIQQNVGARHAKCEVLLFLHADNWLDPGAGTQIQSALANPAVCCGAFRQRIEHPARIYRWLEGGNAWRARWRGLPYGDQGLFFRRSLFDQLGGFPEVPIMEDLILMRQARKTTRPILLPGPIHVSPRRWQAHGVLRQTARNWSLVLAERCGISPVRLADWYPRHADSKPDECEVST